MVTIVLITLGGIIYLKCGPKTLITRAQVKTGAIVTIDNHSFYILEIRNEINKIKQLHLCYYFISPISKTNGSYVEITIE